MYAQEMVRLLCQISYNVYKAYSDTLVCKYQDIAKPTSAFLRLLGKLIKETSWSYFCHLLI